MANSATYINPEFKQIIKRVPIINYAGTTISYSQFSKFQKCEKEWELNFKLKIKSPPGIQLVFGSALHDTIYQYIKTMYIKSGKDAANLNLDEMFKVKFKETYLHEYTKFGSHFSTKEELANFFVDGVSILRWLQKKRSSYFSLRGTKLVAIELPIYLQIKGVYLLGYIDMILYDVKTKKYTLYDIKTSTRGWGDYKKKDKISTNQLLLYKIFFAKQYNIDISNIDIEYFIVKRKINEDSLWPQKRVQEFVPASGKLSLKKVDSELNQFIDTVFDDEGKVKDYAFKSNSGFKDYNCTFCQFKDQDDKCPIKNRFNYDTSGNDRKH